MRSGYVTIVIAVLFACSGRVEAPVLSEAKAGNPDILEVHSDALQELVIQQVRATRLAEVLTLAGRMQYSLDGYARMGTPLIGTVNAVQGHLGEKVTVGQVVASLESAEIARAYSDFTKAESELQFTQRSFELSKDLYRVKSLSKNEFGQAQNDYNKAQAEYARARQRLLTLRVSPAELDKPARERRIRTQLDLKSPLKGVIVEKNVTVGQVVGQDPAETLFTVADLEMLQVVAEVYERDLRFLRVGMAATVTVESFPDHVFPATLVHVGEFVDPATRTIKIRCDVTNIEDKLKPGMFARMHVVLSSAPTAVVLPRTAVVRMGLETVVFVHRSEIGRAHV